MKKSIKKEHSDSKSAVKIKNEAENPASKKRKLSESSECKPDVTALNSDTRCNTHCQLESEKFYELYRSVETNYYDPGNDFVRTIYYRTLDGAIKGLKGEVRDHGEWWDPKVDKEKPEDQLCNDDLYYDGKSGVGVLNLKPEVLEKLYVCPDGYKISQQLTGSFSCEGGSKNGGHVGIQLHLREVWHKVDKTAKVTGSFYKSYYANYWNGLHRKTHACIVEAKWVRMCDAETLTAEAAEME